MRRRGSIARLGGAGGLSLAARAPVRRANFIVARGRAPGLSLAARALMRRLNFIAALDGAVAWVAFAISFSAAQTTFQPLPLKQFLEENGWVSLPQPDERMGHGSGI